MLVYRIKHIPTGKYLLDDEEGYFLANFGTIFPKKIDLFNDIFDPFNPQNSISVKYLNNIIRIYPDKLEVEEWEMKKC